MRYCSVLCWYVLGSVVLCSIVECYPMLVLFSVVHFCAVLFEHLTSFIERPPAVAVLNGGLCPSCHYKGPAVTAMDWPRAWWAGVFWPGARGSEASATTLDNQNNGG